jgi:hypothetical protein
MVQRAPKNHEIKSQDKWHYLRILDHSLEVLITNLKSGTPEKYTAALQTFGNKHDWNWHRISNIGNSYQILANLIQEVQEEYQLLAWHYDKEDPSNNKGHFYDVTVSSDTGLPWIYDLINLSKLKENADERLERLPTYNQINDQFRQLLMTDQESLSTIMSTVKYNCHRKAMERNFYEHLKQVNLICENRVEVKNNLKCTKVLDFGGESLWNISYAKLSSSLGMYNIYSINLWQDLLDPQIVGNDDGNVEITRGLRSKLNFGADSDAWYIISEIDKEFKSLHPVHVTKMLLGPFENRYQTKPETVNQLDIATELLIRNPQIGLLRANVQYSYAPNHEVADEGTRQIIHRHDWHDEIIVCPAQYSALVSNSVLGDRIRVFES